MRGNSRKRDQRRSTTFILGAAVAVSAMSGLAHGQTIASWLNPVDGTWTDASKWSSNPTYPNNGASTYDVVIGTAGGPYTVSLSSSVTVNSITLDSPSATFSKGTGTLDVAGSINVLAGTLRLSDGTITHATINGSESSNVLLSLAKWNGATLNTNATVSMSQDIYGLTFTGGHRVALDNSLSHCELLFWNSQTVGGSTEFVFEGTNASTSQGIRNYNATTLTIAPGTIIRTGTGGGFVGDQGTVGALINNGLIWAQTPGRELLVANNWTNQGTLRVSAGTLTLGGRFTPASIGIIENTGGVLRFRGDITNPGVFDIDPSLGSVDFGGTIHGGILRIRAGAEVAFAPALDDVTLDAELPFTANFIGVQKNLTLTDDTISLLRAPGSSYARLNFVDSTPQKLSGTGTIILNGDTGNDSVEDGVVSISAGSLTIGPGITVRTGTNGGVVGGNGFVNQGTLTAQTPNKRLRIVGNNWSNVGVLKIDGGHLSLGGSFSTSNLGTIQRSTGTLSISGTVNNQSSTLDLAMSPGLWQLGYSLGIGNATGQFNGGTILGAPGATLTSERGVLSDVTLDTDLLVTSALYIDPGTVTLLSGRQIVMNNGANLTNAGISQIDGGGEIVFDGGTLASNVYASSSAALTLRPGITVRTGNGSGFVGSNSSFGQGTLINQGTILSQTPGRSITLAGNWTNQGTIVLSQGTLNLGGTFTTDGIGTLQTSGGTVNITGALDNAGATLLLDGTLGSWFLNGGARITGGTLAASGAERFFSGTGASTVNGAAIRADFTALSGSTLTFNNSSFIGEANEIRLSGTTSRSLVRLDGTTSLSGLKEIVFAGSSDANQLLHSSGTLLVTPSTIVRNADGGGGTFGGTTTTANQGTISAQSSGLPLYVVGSSVANTGVLEARNGGTLIVQNLIGNAGDISIGTNSAVRVSGSYTINRPVTVPMGAALSLSGSWSNASTISVQSGSLSIAGSVASFGSISLANSELWVLGSFTTAQVKAIDLSHSTIAIGSTGVINNTGDFISLEEPGNSWTLSGGTIINGSISGSPGSSMVVAGSGGTFDGVTIGCGIDVRPGSALSLSGGWSNSGAIIVNSATLHLGGTPGPIGSITISNGTLGIRRTMPYPELTTTLDSISRTNSAIVIEGATIGDPIHAFVIDGTMTPLFIQSGTLLSGTLLSSGGGFMKTLGTVVIDGTTVAVPINIPAGSTLRVRGGGRVQNVVTMDGGAYVLNGSFLRPDIGTIVRNGGTLTLTGTMENGGGVLDLNQIGTLILSAGTINGGSIAGSTAAPIVLLDQSTSAGAGTLSAVNLAAPVVMGFNSQLNLVNGLTLAGTNLDCSAGGSITFRGTQLLGGDGTVIAGSRGVRASGGSLTIGSGIAVINSPSTGSLGGGSDPIINQGLVSSRGGSGTLFVSGNVTNQGTIDARDGRSLSITSTPPNFSAGTLTGGAWSIGANSTMTLGSSTITTNDANILLDGVGSTFAPINQLRKNLGLFSISNGRNFSSVGSLTNSGTINIGSLSTLSVLDSIDNTSGLIDLNCKMIVDYSGVSPLSDLVGQIGTHIISSAANADPDLAIGSMDDGNVVLLQLTTLGDANLDGAVNYTDLVALSQNYQSSSLAGPGWTGGDFNYDGSVNLTDLYSLGYQYNDPLHPLPEALESLGLPAIEVPEPAFALLLASAAWPLQRPRTRRRARRSPAHS